MSAPGDWDVVIVGAGPAGLNAARVAAGHGARTLVLERARHPRYKTCGGGLLGTSLAAVSPHLDVPVRDRIHSVTFTHDGRRPLTRDSDTPVLAMVRRDEFDDALRAAAEDAGAVLWQDATVRGVRQDNGRAYARLADGREPAGRVLIGADGSAGVTARHVGARFDQVDLGLEREIEVPDQVAARRSGRLLIDWGRDPGSYGWVFPKGPVLTVGVIAGRGEGARTRAYLDRFVQRLGLSAHPVQHDSGHLTRCRSVDSPLGAGRVLLAGDAAGLLEPWTREGISYALRSGALAGEAVAAPDTGTTVLRRYTAAVTRDLQPQMVAGRRLLAAFERHPGAFHTGLATRPGWRAFRRFCLGEEGFARTVDRRPVRLALAALGARRPGTARVGVR